MEIANLILEYIKALIWPATILVLFALYRSQIINMFNRIKKADLPGGISIETFPEHIKEAKELSEEIKQEKHPNKAQRNYQSLPLTEANARMINLGLSPSPTGLEFSQYRLMSDQDANLALAGLRMEVEIMLKNLAKGFKITINNKESIKGITQKLKEKKAITSHQEELINVVTRLCNAAIHGIKVTSDQAKEILDIAEILRDDYISWLSWGFSKE